MWKRLINCLPPPPLSKFLDPPLATILFIDFVSGCYSVREFAEQKVRCTVSWCLRAMSAGVSVRSDGHPRTAARGDRGRTRPGGSPQHRSAFLQLDSVPSERRADRVTFGRPRRLPARQCPIAAVQCRHVGWWSQ